VPFIPQKDADFLREQFAKELTNEVKLIYFMDRPPSPLFVPGRRACIYCKETGEILQEVVSLSDKIKLEVHEFDNERELARQHGVGRVPAILLRGAGKGTARYFGIPAGHEFGTFVNAIIDLSGGQAQLSSQTIEKLNTLDQKVLIQVFVTPT